MTSTQSTEQPDPAPANAILAFHFENSRPTSPAPTLSPKRPRTPSQSPFCITPTIAPACSSGSTHLQVPPQLSLNLQPHITNLVTNLHSLHSSWVHAKDDLRKSHAEVVTIVDSWKLLQRLGYEMDLSMQDFEALFLRGCEKEAGGRYAYVAREEREQARKRGEEICRERKDMMRRLRAAAVRYKEAKRLCGTCKERFFEGRKVWREAVRKEKERAMERVGEEEGGGRWRVGEWEGSDGRGVMRGEC